MRVRWLTEEEKAERKRKQRIQKKARDAVYMALKSGKLVKKPCEKCGAKDVHAHHPDHKKRMEIVWLCPKCHKKEGRHT